VCQTNYNSICEWMRIDKQQARLSPKWFQLFV
jgi:hypothetical protein